MRLMVRWLAGCFVGTLLIGVTSPFFVRSYLPQVPDAVRNSAVPAAGNYRWRSEGYATTVIGDHGMPGRREVPSKPAGTIRVALWGDSQAEGVCVSDDQKMFARIEQAAESSGHEVQILPFARSGEDASHWRTEMPSVEKNLAIDVHLFLIAELSDLKAATAAPIDVDAVETSSRSRIAAHVPAFLIQAARHLLTNHDGSRRQLRFSVGPVKGQAIDAKPTDHVDTKQEGQIAVWRTVMTALKQTTDRRIVIAYAPRSPHVSGGKVRLHDPQDESFQAMERAALQAGLKIVDTRDALANVARQGNWPHGFHNGQIGDGHLNAIGNTVVAEQIVQSMFRAN